MSVASHLTKYFFISSDSGWSGAPFHCVLSQWTQHCNRTRFTSDDQCLGSFEKKQYLLHRSQSEKSSKLRPELLGGKFFLWYVEARKGSTVIFWVMFILLYFYIKWSIFCPHRLFFTYIHCSCIMQRFLKLPCRIVTSGKLIMRYRNVCFQQFSCTINCTFYIPQKCLFLRVTRLMPVHVRNFYEPRFHALAGDV